MMVSEIISGATQTTVERRENGARFGTPSALTVDAQPIGRGTTEPTSRRLDHARGPWWAGSNCSCSDHRCGPFCSVGLWTYGRESRAFVGWVERKKAKTHQSAFADQGWVSQGFKPILRPTLHWPEKAAFAISASGGPRAIFRADRGGPPDVDEARECARAAKRPERIRARRGP